MGRYASEVRELDGSVRHGPCDGPERAPRLWVRPGRRRAGVKGAKRPWRTLDTGLRSPSHAILSQDLAPARSWLPKGDTSAQASCLAHPTIAAPRRSQWIEISEGDSRQLRDSRPITPPNRH